MNDKFITNTGYFKFNAKTNNVIFFEMGKDLFTEELKEKSLNRWIPIDEFDYFGTPVIHESINKVIAYLNILSEDDESFLLDFTLNDNDYVIEINNTLKLVGYESPILDVIIKKFATKDEMSVVSKIGEIIKKTVTISDYSILYVDIKDDHAIYNLESEQRHYKYSDILENIKFAGKRYVFTKDYVDETLSKLTELSEVGDIVHITYPFYDEEKKLILFYDGFLSVCELNQFGEPGKLVGMVKKLSSVEMVRKRENHFDPLTGLKNRAVCKEELQEIISKEKYGYCILIELNNLEYFNDNFGYEIGDQSITTQANIVRDFFYSTDYVYRYGGDEFLVFLEKKNMIGDINLLLSQMATVFNQEKFKVGGVQIDLGAKVGIFEFTEEAKGISRDNLIKASEIALIKARVKGKNGSHIIDLIEVQQYRKRVKFESDIIDYVNQRKFVPYYQPIVNIVGDKIVGVETIARIEHDVWGVVDTNDFIDFIEKKDSVDHFDYVIFDKAIKNFLEWKRKGILEDNFELSFNLSISAINSSFVDSIKFIVNKYKLNPEFIYFEVDIDIATEEDTKKIMLNKLIEQGFKLTIINSEISKEMLTCLRELEVSRLKVSKEIIEGISSDELSPILLDSLVQFAKKNNLSLVADGVKEKEHIVKLDTLGVSYVKGAYISKALVKDTFEEYLKEYSNAISGR